MVFVRHRSGPTYYGYECLGTRYFKVPSPELWQQTSADNHGGVTLDDVVVDDYDEVLWRLRGLYGLKNFVGRRMLALGGALGKWDATAPEVARKRYQLDIVPIEYKELAARLEAIQSDAKLQEQFAAWTDRYLALPNTKLETKKEFVHRAFGVYLVFRQWLSEHQASAITVASCMGTIFGVSNTAACMPLSWLNDEGLHRLLRVGFRGHAAGHPAALHRRQAGVHAQLDLPAPGHGHLRPLHAPRGAWTANATNRCGS